MEHYNISEAIDAQKRYCKENEFPHFAPRNGRCYRCNQNIYKEINGYGISVEAAGTKLITGCPHCSWSFCE